MPTYEITFTGRKVGAIGIFYTIVARRTAATPQDAILALYDEYDHIAQPVCRVVPEGTDALYNTHRRVPLADHTDDISADEAKEENAREDSAEEKKGYE